MYYIYMFASDWWLRITSIHLVTHFEKCQTFGKSISDERLSSHMSIVSHRRKWTLNAQLEMKPIKNEQWRIIISLEPRVTLTQWKCCGDHRLHLAFVWCRACWCAYTKCWITVCIYVSVLSVKWDSICTKFDPWHISKNIAIALW